MVRLPFLYGEKDERAYLMKVYFLVHAKIIIAAYMHVARKVELQEQH